MAQVVSIGIISESLLQQHLLQSVITEQGYQVAVNTHPERLSKAVLLSETISIWVVDIIDEDYHSDALDHLLDHAVAPVFIGEGVSPDRNSEEFPGWKRRLVGKLKDMSPPSIQPKEAPELDLTKFATGPSVKEKARMSEQLSRVPKNTITELWVLAASLGGPEAVKEFLDRLPEDFPVAFVYAQHIDQGCVEGLVNSIGRHTLLDMVMMQHQGHIKNSEIQVVPVHQEVCFRTDQKVELLDNEWSGPYGPSIDHLMRNVVAGWGSKANMIVFSGMGSDGTLGATYVQDAGGQVWAQSTESAVQPSMPDSVSELEFVNTRGTPTELADQLVRHIERQYSNSMPEAFNQ